MPETARRSTRTHSVQNSLWKKLRTFRKAEYGMNHSTRQVEHDLSCLDRPGICDRRRTLCASSERKTTFFAKKETTMSELKMVFKTAHVCDFARKL